MDRTSFRKQVQIACVAVCAALLVFCGTGITTPCSAQNSKKKSSSILSRKSKAKSSSAKKTLMPKSNSAAASTQTTQTIQTTQIPQTLTPAQFVEQAKANPKGWISAPLQGKFKFIYYEKMVQDEVGNSYVLGGNYKNGDTIIFENGTKIIGTTTYSFGFIVKYSPKGEVLWVRTIKGTKEPGKYADIVINSKGEIFVCGTISCDKEYDFGNGIVIKGKRGAPNAFLAKYDADGNVKWVKEQPHLSNGYVDFMSMKIDKDDNLYCAGNLWFGYHDKKTATFTFSPKAAVTITASKAALLVKFDANGTAQWARSVVGESEDSYFNELSLDNSGNMVVVGSVKGGSFAFGNKVSVTPATSGDSYFTNYLIVKYDAMGQAQWAKASTSNGKTEGLAVATDSQGAVYAVTKVLSADKTSDSTIHDFGNKVSFSMASDSYQFYLIVKYDAEGNTQWLKSTKGGNNEFKDIVVDKDDNIFAVGQTPSYNAFDGISVPKYKVGASSYAPILVELTPDGLVKYVTTGLISAYKDSKIKCISVTDKGIYLLLDLRTKEYVFETGVSFTGTQDYNPAIIKFER